jgi:superoxide reductase
MAVNNLEVYKCDKCGNIVKVYQGGGGDLFCCNQKMALLSENTVDAALEKHVPVNEKVEGGVNVKVGSVAHPMGDDHYIQWVELHDGDKIYSKFLKPGDEPSVSFPAEGGNLTAKAYCNLHGLWKS